jgi:hypothetical protein
VPVGRIGGWGNTGQTSRASGVVIQPPQPDLEAALAEVAKQTDAAWEAKARPDVASILAAYRSRRP